MKKIISFIVLVVLVVALTACNSGIIPEQWCVNEATRCCLQDYEGDIDFDQDFAGGGIVCIEIDGLYLAEKVFESCDCNVEMYEITVWYSAKGAWELKYVKYFACILYDKSATKFVKENQIIDLDVEEIEDGGVK